MTGAGQTSFPLSRRDLLTGAGASLLVSVVKPTLSLGDNRPVIPIDINQSRSQQTLVLAGGKRIEDFPGGCRVVIPGQVEIPITKWIWKPAEQVGNASFVKLTLEGLDPRHRPRLVGQGIGDMLRVHDPGSGRASSLEMRNLDIQGGYYGDAFRPDSLSELVMENVRISGGRNCMLLPTYPTIARLNGCEFRFGGFGDGQTHTVYVNYIKRFIARDCSFHSPLTQGHAFKCYAFETIVDRCRVASWFDPAVHKKGYGGDLPVMDVGAWGHSLIRGCEITRLPPARGVCIDFRNRQWKKGYNGYAPPDWGTTVVPPGAVDNTDPENPHLFHHFVAGNIFRNGLLPDGGLSDEIKADPGYMLRNNGTTPWNSHGVKADHLQAKPLGWLPKNERAVVWMMANETRGVPFRGRFSDRPYGDPALVAPVRRFAGEKNALPYFPDKYEALMARLRN